MGLFDRFKHGKEKEQEDQGQRQQEDYKAPEGPPPSYAGSSYPRQTKSDSTGQVHREAEYTAPAGPPPAKTHNDYAPPSGPPPSHRAEDYASSAGPPPSQRAEKYEAPSGPPPSRTQQEYAPPSGPPPSKSNDAYASPCGLPPSYHDWQSIPDTSLLPPPPSFSKDKSSTTNASEWLATAAWDWTDANQPFRPSKPHPDLYQAVSTGQIDLRAPEHIGRGEVITKSGPLSKIRTTIDSKDHCYLSALPLYFEHVDSPFRTERQKTIYYEIKIEKLGRLRDGSDSAVALGYCVAPYPTWRMPGWNRGSLAVHSDDGSRYVSHDAGGFDFTNPVVAGETIGLGIRFSIPQWKPNQTVNSQGQPLQAEVFFTRNGQYSGGWNIQEGLDADDAWRAEFLDGKWDLYAAIGTFGDVDVSVNFGAQRHLYDPATFRGL